MRTIRRIVIHCTDSPDARDIGAREITQWHRARGWKTIGYHWVVRRTGQVEIGRPESDIGAHVEGHNADTIGIVWVGQKEPTADQYEALIAKAVDCMVRFDVNVDAVLGHRELDHHKTCPNIDMNVFRADARQLLESLG